MQRVGIAAGRDEVEGILHLPDVAPVGGVVALGGRGGGMEGGAYLCEALAGSGIAALRFGFRSDDDLGVHLAHCAAAIRLLRAHPQVPQRIGVVGHSYGGAVAAVAAGRDSRIRAAVLLAAPAARPYFGTWKPLAELSRTRARVLLVVAGADELVEPGNAERYAMLLTRAGVSHRLVTIEGADHAFSASDGRARLLAEVTGWLRDAFA